MATDVKEFETIEKEQAGKAESKGLRSDLNMAFQLALDRTKKPKQKIIIASRMQDGSMVVDLTPGPDIRSKKYRSPRILTSTEEGAFRFALLDKFKEASNLVVTSGRISNEGLKENSFGDFFNSGCYVRVLKGEENMVGEWIVENKPGDSCIKTLQLETRREKGYVVENWSITGKPNTGWFKLPMQGGIKV